MDFECSLTRRNGTVVFCTSLRLPGTEVALRWLGMPSASTCMSTVASADSATSRRPSLSAVACETSESTDSSAHVCPSASCKASPSRYWAAASAIRREYSGIILPIGSGLALEPM